MADTTTPSSTAANPTAGGGGGGSSSDFHDTPHFPHHVGPRTWLILSGTSHVGLRLARLALAHGDNVVLGVPPAAYADLQAAVASSAAPATATATVTAGGAGGSGNKDAAGGGLDSPFARFESEQLRHFLLELDDIYAAAAASEAAAAAATAATGSSSPEDNPRSPTSPMDEKTPSSGGGGGGGGAAVAGPPRRRLRPVALDPRAMGHCQAAMATGVAAFGAVDIVVCNASQVVVGAVEELGVSEETLALVRDQFETNFFGNVNAIKAAVPAMRGSGRGGHIVVITGITGHLGTPGLGAYCASGWALEGYCDSIAYEIAPFNIKVSIVQPMLETAVLPNLIRAPPAMSQYAPGAHPAPLSRNVVGGLLDRIHGMEQHQHQHQRQYQRYPDDDERRGSAATDQTSGSEPNGEARAPSKSLGSSAEVSVHEPRLPPELLDGLIRETLFSVCAIAGHPNPPQRHIVGQEGVISVKEKLKTVSIELEDLVSASAAVDFTFEEEQ